jgi:hypothetical protein
MSNNNLKHFGILFGVPGYFSRQFIPITTLDVSSNLIENINFTFEYSEGLKYLFMQGNKLKVLEASIFAPLRLLISLNISRNQLSLIERNTFTNLNTLEYLNASSNLIKFVYEDQFSTLIYLVDLDISNNSIEKIHSKTLANQMRLKNLFIHLNPLKYIDKLDGIDAIRNFHLDSHLIVANFSNVFNLKESIQITLYKKSRGISYLKAVNVITYLQNVSDYDLNEYCHASMYLIKHSVSLNLKTDQDAGEFFIHCEQYSSEFMFIESSLHQ